MTETMKEKMARIQQRKMGLDAQLTSNAPTPGQPVKTPPSSKAEVTPPPPPPKKSSAEEAKKAAAVPSVDSKAEVTPPLPGLPPSSEVAEEAAKKAAAVPPVQPPPPPPPPKKSSAEEAKKAAAVPSVDSKAEVTPPLPGLPPSSELAEEAAKKAAEEAKKAAAVPSVDSKAEVPPVQPPPPPPPPPKKSSAEVKPITSANGLLDVIKKAKESLKPISPPVDSNVEEIPLSSAESNVPPVKLPPPPPRQPEPPVESRQPSGPPPRKGTGKLKVPAEDLLGQEIEAAKQALQEAQEIAQAALREVQLRMDRLEQLQRDQDRFKSLTSVADNRGTPPPPPPPREAVPPPPAKKDDPDLAAHKALTLANGLLNAITEGMASLIPIPDAVKRKESFPLQKTQYTLHNSDNDSGSDSELEDLIWPSPKTPEPSLAQKKLLAQREAKAKQEKDQSAERSSRIAEPPRSAVIQVGAVPMNTSLIDKVLQHKPLTQSHDDSGWSSEEDNKQNVAHKRKAQELGKEILIHTTSPTSSSRTPTSPTQTGSKGKNGPSR